MSAGEGGMMLWSGCTRGHVNFGRVLNTGMRTPQVLLQAMCWQCERVGCSSFTRRLIVPEHSATKNARSPVIRSQARPAICTRQALAPDCVDVRQQVFKGKAAEPFPQTVLRRAAVGLAL